MRCFEFIGRNLMVASSGDPNEVVELEPIVGRTDVDADAASGSTADIWSSIGRYPPQTQYDHISRRRRRSRSSPVRAVEDKIGQKVRARSPSARSPRQRRVRERSRERIAQHPETFAPPEYPPESETPSEEYLKTSNSHWCGAASACGTAYFSLCPPVAPLRLIPVVTPTRPPMAPSVYSGVTRIARISFAKDREDCHKTVHGLVRELVASLPLQTSNREPAACASSTAHTPHSENEEPMISSRSYVKIRHSSMSTYSRGDQEQRSIAIQAKSTQDDDTLSGQKETGSDAAPAEEWLGGVRALRDSHVRLVLRQLRHIDRLNRTLDRAARPPPPPPPSSPRAPPAFTPVALPVAVTAQAQV